FRDDSDRFDFLGLLAELGERFGARVHAYVLMDNHFHMLLETPEANLSRAMQWLGVSYGVWFNRRHRRVGHLFQGRFKSLIVEDDAGWQEVARYSLGFQGNCLRLSGQARGPRLPRRGQYQRPGLAKRMSMAPWQIWTRTFAFGKHPAVILSNAERVIRSLAFVDI
ncbi:MAG: transposase, partial [Candidatus Omnitrophica bacterium]|nr:transposase [Candidatus Omnitrophota bacterium]